MPQSISETSELEDEGSSARSVLDFLYHDSRRIGSFLAQFEGDGHLQSLTRTKDGLRGKKRKSEADAKGTIGVASGTYKGSTETNVELGEGYARVFDPYWANARAFLDHASEHQLLQPNMDCAEVGQFVLAKGWLSVLDLAMFKDAWKLPTVQRKVREGAAPTKKVSQMTSAEKQAHQEQKENTDMMLEMIQIMPHSVHATMVTSDESPKLLWCTLRDEYLVVPASDIVLAHGALMPGEWTIMGILNAQPDFFTPESHDETDLEPGLMQSVVGQVSKLIAPVVRLSLGRPGAAHAITPLLIFREVA
jgi:hypothetical protein